MYDRIIILFQALLKNWNSILAGIGAIGIIIFTFMPKGESYRDFFIILAANGAIWTLIEIKTQMFKKGDTSYLKYSDMRAARPDIVKVMKEQMSIKRKSTLFIKIMGGRIRTISDIIREVMNDFVTEKIHSKDICIQILTLDPAFVRNSFGSILVDQAIKERNDTYANLIEQLSFELSQLNKEPRFKNNNIQIEIKHYSTHPFIYGFVIGESHVFWGYFTWNFEHEDFIGPTNKCYQFYKGMRDFPDFYDWIVNRIDFLWMNYRHSAAQKKLLSTPSSSTKDEA
jgi:hypothetical protein